MPTGENLSREEHILAFNLYSQFLLAPSTSETPSGEMDWL